MNIDAFFTELTFREEWTVLFRMNVRAFLVRVIAVGPMTALYLFLIFLIAFMNISLLRFYTYIVLVLREVNHCIPIASESNFL
jgi:hypothetical protein